MNSKSLKKIHSKVYKDFFLKNSLVISVPFSFNWCSGGEFFEVLSIKGKLPLRMFIGVCEKNNDGVNIGNIIEYNYEKKDFISRKAQNVLTYYNTIKQYLDSTFLLKDKSFEITVLSEIGMYMGQDFEHVLSAGISSLLHILNGCLLADDITKLSNITVKDLGKTKYTDLISDARDLCYQINKKPNFLTQLNAIVDSKYPIVCLHTGKDNSVKKILGKIGRLNTLDKSLGDIPFAPIDYFVTYSGISVTNSQAGNDLEWNFDFHKLSTLKRLISENLLLEKNDLKTGEKKFGGHFSGFIDLINQNSLNSIMELYKNPTGEDKIYNYITLIGKIRLLIYVFTEHGKQFSNVLNIFIKEYFQKFGPIGIVPHANSLKSGTFLTVIEYNKSRSSIDERLKDVKSYFPSASFIYRSREDEYDERGLVIEHDIDNGIIADVLDPNLHTYHRIDGSYITGSFHEILEHPDVDVAFDMSDGKVYIGGEKTTSREFFSQTAIVELMGYMIKEGKNAISNKELPRSSFTRDKNTLNSKVINPLKKLIKKKLGKDLLLSSSGDIGSFTISLENSGLNIGIMKRVAPYRD